jgi:hypothetical protein
MTSNTTNLGASSPLPEGGKSLRIHSVPTDSPSASGCIATLPSTLIHLESRGHMKYLALSLALAASNSTAFEVEKSPDDQSFLYVNQVPVVMIGTIAFSVFRIPEERAQFEVSTSTETHLELKAKLKLGEPVTKDEAIKVLEIYYRNTAFDFDSLKIRDIKIDTPRYAVWCSNPTIFGCLEWNGAAGTWVEYEVNGKNRSGGMTGYSKVIQLIRKFSGSAKQQNESASSPKA